MSLIPAETKLLVYLFFVIFIISLILYIIAIIKGIILAIKINKKINSKFPLILFIILLFFPGINLFILWQLLKDVQEVQAKSKLNNRISIFKTFISLGLAFTLLVNIVIIVFFSFVLIYPYDTISKIIVIILPLFSLCLVAILFKWILYIFNKLKSAAGIA